MNGKKKATCRRPHFVTSLRNIILKCYNGRRILLVMIVWLYYYTVDDEDGINPTTGATALPNDAVARTIQTRYRNYICIYGILYVYVCVCACMFVCVCERASAVKRRRRGAGATVTGIRNASPSRYIWRGRAREPSACAFDRNIRGFSPGERGAASRSRRDAPTWAPHTHALTRTGERRWWRSTAAVRRGSSSAVDGGVCKGYTFGVRGRKDAHRRRAEPPPPPHQDRNQSPSPWRRRSVSAPCTQHRRRRNSRD